MTKQDEFITYKLYTHLFCRINNYILSFKLLTRTSFLFFFGIFDKVTMKMVKLSRPLPLSIVIFSEIFSRPVEPSSFLMRTREFSRRNTTTMWKIRKCQFLSKFFLIYQYLLQDMLNKRDKFISFSRKVMVY